MVTQTAITHLSRPDNELSFFDWTMEQAKMKQTFQKNTPMRVEGIVAFGSSPLDSFQYRLNLENEKMNLWLENRSSKKQWESGMLTLEDVVPAREVIPHAKIADYAECFHRALESANDCSSSGEYQRELRALSNDHLSVDFTLTIKVFESLWTPTYKFDLKPIPLEKVDILEAKLRDQDEKLARLRDVEEELAILRKGGSCVVSEPIYLQATSTHPAKQNGVLRWSGMDGKSFKIHPSGAIEVLVTGVYVINVVLHHSNSIVGETFCLMKGGQSVGSCFDGFIDNSLIMSAPLMVTLALKAHDKISVLYKGNHQAHTGSQLSAILLR